MPLAIGFHSFFQIPDIPRDEWVAHIPARIHVIPGEHNIPTGELRPMDIPNPCRCGVSNWTMDSPIWSATRTAGRTSRSRRAEEVETLFGPKFTVATIWLPAAPAGQPREFICFEPLSTIISGVNLAHEGKWRSHRPRLRREVDGEFLDPRKWFMNAAYWVRQNKTTVMEAVPTLPAAGMGNRPFGIHLGPLSCNRQEHE